MRHLQAHGRNLIYPSGQLPPNPRATPTLARQALGRGLSPRGQRLTPAHSKAALGRPLSSLVEVRPKAAEDERRSRPHVSAPSSMRKNAAHEKSNVANPPETKHSHSQRLTLEVEQDGEER